MCWCKKNYWWCGGGCKKQTCCKEKSDTINISWLPVAQVCWWTAIVEIDWHYFQQDLETCYWAWDWTWSFTSISASWNVDVWGNLWVTWNTDLGWDLWVTWDTNLWGDLTVTWQSTFNWGADFSGTVDLTWANVIFDADEICDEIVTCINNDATVQAAINWVASSFGCSDVASCINSDTAVRAAINSLIASWTSSFSCADVADCITNNAAVQSALTAFVTNLINTWDFNPTWDRDFTWATVTWVWWWTSTWISTCAATSDTWSYIEESVPWQFLFGNWPTGICYTAQETWFLIIKFRGRSSNSWGVEATVNWTVTWSSWSLPTWQTESSVIVWNVTAWDSVCLQNLNPIRNVDADQIRVCLATQACSSILTNA